jgi:hypothetical protein
VGESTIGVPKATIIKSIFGSFSNVFLNTKNWKKTQKPWNNVKFDIFFLRHMHFLKKLTPYIFKLKIFISNNGYKIFKNSITYFPQG